VKFSLPCPLCLFIIFLAFSFFFWSSFCCFDCSLYLLPFFLEEERTVLVFLLVDFVVGGCCGWIAFGCMLRFGGTRFDCFVNGGAHNKISTLE
jgi:hypothetical protein